MRHKCLTAAILVAWVALLLTISPVAAQDAQGNGATAKDLTPGTPEYVEWALGKKVSLTGMKKTHDGVFESLREQVVVNFHYDLTALKRVGVRSDAEVSIALKDLPLRSVLEFVLSQAELTYMYNEGVVMITTPARSNREPTRIASQQISQEGRSG
jgi:hypothetical protein